jgi:O-antigen ligase
LRYAAPNFDPNDLALTLALAIPLAWYVAVRKNGKIDRWIYFAYPALGLGAVFLTASRAGLVCSALALLIIPWTLPRLSLRSKVVLSTCALVSSVVIATHIPAHTWARLASTESDLTQGTLGNRTVIWRAGVMAYSRHPIMGAGVGTFKTVVGEFLAVDHEAHNTFLSILVDVGFIGFLLFATALFVAVVLIWRMPPLEFKLWLIQGLTWAAGVNTLAWEDRKPTWLILALLAVHSAAVWRTRDTSPAARVAVPISPVLNGAEAEELVPR